MTRLMLTLHCAEEGFILSAGCGLDCVRCTQHFRRAIYRHGSGYFGVMRKICSHHAPVLFSMFQKHLSSL